jgi:hypothetical protein
LLQRNMAADARQTAAGVKTKFNTRADLGLTQRTSTSFACTKHLQLATLLEELRSRHSACKHPLCSTATVLCCLSCTDVQGWRGMQFFLLGRSGVVKRGAIVPARIPCCCCVC